jgi:phage-related protein
VSWIVETLNATVDEEVAALPPEMRARLAHIVRLIVEFGVERTGHPHVKHLEGPLWEMRVSGRGGIARAIYVTAKARRVVIVRVFIKKTQKTPRHELETARRRAAEIE